MHTRRLLRRVRLRAVIPLLVVAALLAPVGVVGVSLYHQWSNCRHFVSGSDQHQICARSGGDRHAVCSNLESSPFMCPEDFLAGHPDLVSARQAGIERQRRECAAQSGGAECLPAQWSAWCQGRYDPTRGYADRLDHCLAAMPGGGR